MGLATFDGPQLLILDEPTNHLDIDSRAELIEAINEYEGACILVSHDRRLLEACVDRLWLVANGTVRAFEGDLADYSRFVLGQSAPQERSKRESAKKANEPASPAPERREAAKPRRDLAPLRKEIDRGRAEDAPLPGSAAPHRRSVGAKRAEPPEIPPRSSISRASAPNWSAR